MKNVFFYFVLLLVCLGRYFFVLAHELAPDESYYWLWSKHLAASYYSKGPGIAWVMHWGTSLFGDGEFGVRFFSPLLSFGTSLSLFFLAQRLFDRKVALLSVLILNLTPIYNVGSILMTIDPLSIFFWSITLLALWKALFSKGYFYWALSGGFLGLGFLCKYTNAIQIFSLLGFLLSERSFREKFKEGGLWVFFAVFLLGTVPVFYWNMENDWITLTHLKERGSLDKSFSLRPAEFLQFFGMHFGIYSPVIFVGLLWATVRSWFDAKKYLSVRFLLWFSLPLILIYMILSFNESGQGNWTAPGFLGIGILLAWQWGRRKTSLRKKYIIQWSALVMAGGMTLLILNTDFLRKIPGVEWPYKKDPSLRLRGWKTSAEEIGKQIARFSAEQKKKEPIFMIANRYQVAASLSYYLKEEVPAVLIGTSQGYPLIHARPTEGIENQFYFWPRYDKPSEQKKQSVPFLGKNALYITDILRNEKPPEKIQQQFQYTEPFSEIRILRHGKLLRTWKMFACYGYKENESLTQAFSKRAKE